jgi:hypothetical protein
MANFDDESAVSRDDLLQRVALMEQMIAEGRRATTRFGWVFVLWGVVDLVGVGLQTLHPRSDLVWPITLGLGIVLQVVGIARCKCAAKGCGQSIESRIVKTVWIMMGIATLLYFAGAMLSHLAWQTSYMAGLLMLIGLAHAISAVILRWQAQGVVAGLWWVGGVAMFFVAMHARMEIFTAEMFFGFVCFGLYAMMLDRKASSTTGTRHG